MKYESKAICLKNGQSALFRAPFVTDIEATAMLQYLSTCAAETEFVIRYPEECTQTPAQEAAYLESINRSKNQLMIVCEIDGELAGNCQIVFNDRIKTRHRAQVMIGILQKYWSLGIGTAMFEEMIRIAAQRQVHQIELEYIEGNERARRLYEKMSFIQYGERPDAIRLRDGTMRKEILMMRNL
ncbi:MAG: GNAT family N-acetyltransferase [Lachnospiraceae bacterium]|nr:GNAT family N-acetyltransferase [Lachnospiraceae bacterium]